MKRNPDKGPQVSADDRELADSNGHGSKLPAVREAAVLALLSERNLEDAADKAGVSERTLRRWLADDATFKSGYEAARTAVFDAGMNRIEAAMGRAVDTMLVLLDEERFPSVRLGAARTIAELGTHQRDAETIMRKLDEIEERQQQKGGM